jgi:two-component system, NtrC family, nitrogen regulation sensor histidine kinase GlnL
MKPAWTGVEMIDFKNTPTKAHAAFDALATWLAVLDTQGDIVFANAALEDALGLSRKQLLGQALADFFESPTALHHALQGARDAQFAALRYDAVLLRPLQSHAQREPLPVHVVIAPSDQGLSGAAGGLEVLVEMLPLEQQVRQEREERLAEQASNYQALIRNLAHEIKNPLGGIRGAAQLVQMEVQSLELREYAQIIIHEADRLHSLVNKLLAPHKQAALFSDINIHEICERVRSLILVEFSEGLRVQRDYDISIPEFRGDREQLIQAVLNIAHNAALALGERRAAGDAHITLRTRVVRNVTFGKQRYRLALKLHVIDNGPGIAESIKDKMFYPLVSGRDGGTGLGLSLAQSFVQQHHGLIECDSAPGCTDFQILIPLP